MTLIEAFGPYFLQMVGRMSNPRQVCKELDICSDPGEVQVLGGHKCTYGPSYWCHTYAHASACKVSMCLSHDSNEFKPVVSTTGGRLLSSSVGAHRTDGIVDSVPFAQQLFFCVHDHRSRDVHDDNKIEINSRVIWLT